MSPWKLFGSVFFAKKRNSGRRVERCVCRNVVAVRIVRGGCFREGKPLPYGGWWTNVAVGVVRDGRFRAHTVTPLQRWGRSTVAIRFVKDRIILCVATVMVRYPSCTRAQIMLQYICQIPRRQRELVITEVI